MFGFIKRLTKGDGELALERLEEQGLRSAPQQRFAVAIVALFAANAMQNMHFRDLVFHGIRLDPTSVGLIIESLQKARARCEQMAAAESDARRRMGMMQPGLVGSVMTIKAQALDWLTVFTILPIRPELTDRVKVAWRGYLQALGDDEKAMESVLNEVASEARSLVQWGYEDELLLSISMDKLDGLRRPAATWGV